MRTSQASSSSARLRSDGVMSDQRRRQKPIRHAEAPREKGAAS